MKKLAATIVACCMLSNQVFAVGTGAFTNQVVSSKALGMGNSFVAIADDPSAVFFNPAGLTQMDNLAVSVGIAPHFYATTYTSDSGAVDRSKTGNPLVPNFYAALPFLGGKIAAGIGVSYPMGLKTQWSDTSPLRYVATITDLRVTHVNPSIAYKVCDNLSLGAGFDYAYVEADLQSKINSSILNIALGGGQTTLPDANKQMKGSGSAYGYNVGVLYRFLEHHKIGVNYRSELRSKIKGETKLVGLNGAAQALFGGTNYTTDTDTYLNLPQTLMLGYAFNYDKLTLTADAEWVNYSSVDQLKLTFAEGDLNRKAILDLYDQAKEWKSVWNMGAGANYKFNDTWQARGGFYYFPSIVPEHTWSPAIPDSARTAFTFGGSYTVKDLTLDLAYNYAIFHDRTIHNSVGSIATGSPQVNGSYKTDAHVISLNATYKFSGLSSK